MSYYRECPYCGAALDPGEKCDCGQKETARSAPTETDGMKKTFAIDIIAYADKKAREKSGGEIVCVRWKKKEYPF